MFNLTCRHSDACVVVGRAWLAVAVEVVEADGLRLAAHALTAFPYLDELQDAGLRLLCNVAIGQRHTAQVARAGGVQLAACALVRYGTHVSVQTHGLGALRNLAFGDAETKAVVEAGGIRLAVAALEVCRVPEADPNPTQEGVIVQFTELNRLEYYVASEHSA